MPSSLTIKRYIHLFPFIFIIIPLVWSWFWHGFHQNHDKSEKIQFCKSRIRSSSSSSLNYIGPSLISNSHDSEDQVFCPGDYFGDLNNTHVIIKNCRLEMYHKENLLWSSNLNIANDDSPCTLSLQRDGNLVLYRETAIIAHRYGRRIVIFALWESQTNMNPTKTELRIQGQQMQVIQVYKDGAERLFYVDQDHPGFMEDKGKPKKIANKFILKKSEDEDKVVLRRNEYIGDLNGTHLILQTNCNLQLLNKDKVLWSFAPTFRHEMGCVLDIDDRYQVRISGIKNHHRQEIIRSDTYYPFYQLEETWITFENDQPMIIQTLKNGTELIFTALGRAQNNGLWLKRKPRQIAEKTVNISSKEIFKMERMDYIGNLTDLHLTLGQNCDLTLANGTQKLWELQLKLKEDECSLLFKYDGDIYFYGGSYYLLDTSYADRESLVGYQLTLEKNQLIITRQFTNKSPDVYLAGPNTQNQLFRIISYNSIVLNGNDKEDLVLPKMGLIGDVNGVYAIFEKNCNWVFYNKTQVIWESGTSRNEKDRNCALIFKRNGSLEIAHEWSFKTEDPFWSTQNLTIDPLKDILKAELLVNNDGLWLDIVYIDGAVNRFKALEGTHDFIHMPN